MNSLNDVGVYLQSSIKHCCLQHNNWRPKHGSQYDSSRSVVLDCRKLSPIYCQSDNKLNIISCTKRFYYRVIVMYCISLYSINL